jgi:monofunctional glycosyltransferase
MMKLRIATLFMIPLVAATCLVGAGMKGAIKLRSPIPVVSRFMVINDGTVQHRWVAIDDISPALMRAVVVAEDPRFLQHHGVDAKLVWESLKRNLREGHIVRGASTITMQLAKNLFLSPKRTWWRKYNEVLLALTMELFLTKERILELYLNVAEWGPNIYGAGMATHHYFGKNASELSARDAAQLASILPNPKLIDNPVYEKRFAYAALIIGHRLHTWGRRPSLIP